MRIKQKSAGVKRELIKERYKEKEEKVRKGANSEQVWEIRGPGEEVRGPFGKAGEV